MIYKQQSPKPYLKNVIQSFWLIDSEKDEEIKTDKVIPDGFPELIFHYKSQYRANISGSWFLQNHYLVAGQIKNHFYLENTGSVGMFGIKLQPWTLKLLFDVDMNSLTDKVMAVEDLKLPGIEDIITIAIKNISFENRVEDIENLFANLINSKDMRLSKGQKATQLIIDSKGEISIQEVISKTDISERSLERYFKSHIGLSPKFYSRIIRFSNIFNLVQIDNFSWSDVTYLSGFYDQSHFIKNFKEFTGEEPSKYGFTEKNIANFFLNS